NHCSPVNFRAEMSIVASSLGILTHRPRTVMVPGCFFNGLEVSLAFWDRAAAALLVLSIDESTGCFLVFLALTVLKHACLEFILENSGNPFGIVSFSVG